MSTIGTVHSLWRYPVKSMRGEELEEIFAGYAGVYGDRLFAFESSAARKGFPYLTARDYRSMLRYRPRFRYPEKATEPANLLDAEKMGANPISAKPAELIVDVETPNGKTLPIDDPELIAELRAAAGEAHELTLLRSDKAMTDCRPLSIFSIQSAIKLSEEIGIQVDKLRFRANVYLDLRGADGFTEDSFLGRCLRIGSTAVVSVLERDPRCMIITLDPDTAEKEPAILKKIAQAHSGMAGIYAAVLVEGMLRKGDLVELLN